MARFLYRLLRAFNVVGSANESQIRNAMRNTSVMRDLIVEDMAKPLSYVLPLTGTAMSPLFNTNAGDMKTIHDKLVIRKLSGSTQSFLNRVYVDDMVVIRDPNDSRRKYVRRIAALEGAEMACRHGDPPFRIPPRHCWVERENREVDAPDSTSFGPLGLDYIIGRVMYAIRSATDHGRVTNSAYSMASDSIVMAQEPVSQHLSSSPPSESDGNKE